jgi:hypothetical protein
LVDDLIDGAKHVAGKEISTQTGNLMSNSKENTSKSNSADYKEGSGGKVCTATGSGMNRCQ